MSRRQNYTGIDTGTKTVEKKPTRNMWAKVFMAGIANAGDPLTEVTDLKETLGNDTDVAVKNKQGGYSIVPLENIMFEEDGIISDTEKETEEDFTVNEGGDEGNTVQDE